MVCLVVFVDIHKGTVDLFAPRGAGELIQNVPFAEVVPVHRDIPIKPD